ncbi:helix-turn-helix domain-containing protein [Pseudogulbenkiania subflava]|uniref:Transcriptional regulator, contains XRE-family HTH domain n=1 Tax=Pseudogulbenkiania subflava DSM 22618 TaxID=1123014 RepID=A0A1Y6CH68_9NEIS|nr:helix-turn-helix transcriptional regulator [Pseudogulbenkiania subflava]SMF53056.1 Transcriptional regulator, contains XRE-family HTH domain [Pseudogulbenkiania subflava DSM 22618]
MKIGHRIRESRDGKRLSQGELARRVGVSQPAISDWENGKTEPSVDNMRTLAVELGVWFEWLATGRGLREYQGLAQEQPMEYRVQPALPEDEQTLQAIYRKLSPARKEALLDFLKRWG